MNIGSYTFSQFMEKAAEFHGYPAPGLLVGGYMVETAKALLPEGTLFEAVVETKKCLPDAVQLLSLCSAGNQWMKVIDLGKYALSLFDKFTGEGYRVHLDPERMRAYPEILAWFLKQKPKAEQDSEQLLKEIEAAGNSICGVAPIRVRSRMLGHAHMGAIGICSLCGEAYPSNDGLICRGCQGEAPYTLTGVNRSATRGSEPLAVSVPLQQPEGGPTVRVVTAAEAVGKVALHDMTEVIPGESKGAAFKAGQVITAGDVCRLQQMGRFAVAVMDGPDDESFLHENAGIETLAPRLAGENIAWDTPPKEGKINFRATVRGLLSVDSARLLAFNMIPDLMCATRQDASVVDAGTDLAGSRVIPLHIHKDHIAQALHLLEKPLFRVEPLRKAAIGILVTGTEVFQGLIEDKFIPIMEAKAAQYECSVVDRVIVPDDVEAIVKGIDRLRAAGADLLITTGGMSVDPGDVTRVALTRAGLEDMLYGAPVVPGAMSLVGVLPPLSGNGPEAKPMQVLGVPACALFFKTTLFDGLFPRLLAGRKLTRQDVARMGEGGFCMSCKRCTWPKCFFMK